MGDEGSGFEFAVEDFGRTVGVTQGGTGVKVIARGPSSQHPAWLQADEARKMAAALIRCADRADASNAALAAAPPSSA